MQTFLPYPDFARSAGVLDVPRLGKQRVETLQILRAVTIEDYGWRNHPAVTMWVGYTPALVAYGVAVTRRWQVAGYSDTVLPQLVEFLEGAPLRTQRELRDAGLLPPWLGQRALHRSHRAALLRKGPAHYGPVFGATDPDLPYVWPGGAPASPGTGAVSGWVIRGDAEDLAAMTTGGFVGVRPQGDEGPGAPAGTGARNTKRRRQMTMLLAEIAPGERIVVPDGDLLRVGIVRSDYQWRDDAPRGLHHTRKAEWVGSMARAQLRRPVYLQDPRVVFPLRDEPGIAAVTRD